MGSRVGLSWVRLSDGMDRRRLARPVVTYLARSECLVPEPDANVRLLARTQRGETTRCGHCRRHMLTIAPGAKRTLPKVRLSASALRPSWIAARLCSAA